ncbi:MAG: MAPEG family protein [Alphaproteobacteria bacterium]|nr:MAPEG family protein [Alphaproteobacteria bacterium]
MITPIFAGVLTLIYVYLTIQVISARRTNRIGLGDGGNADLLRRMRVHSNFAEYAPLGLLLMFMAEMQGVPAWAMLLVGLVLLAGRFVHAIGLSGTAETPGLRTVGMALTLTALIAAALINLVWPLF